MRDHNRRQLHSRNSGWSAKLWWVFWCELSAGHLLRTDRWTEEIQGGPCGKGRRCRGGLPVSAWPQNQIEGKLNTTNQNTRQRCCCKRAR